MSNLEPLLNPLFLFPTGAIVVLDLLSPFYYLFWMKSKNFLRVKWLILLKPFSSIACIYFMFTQFGAGFYLGAAYMLLTPIFALPVFLTLLFQIVIFRDEFGFPHKKYVITLLGGLAIVFSLVVPSILYSPIKNACAKANISKFTIIARALDEYFAIHNTYPENLVALTPSFLSVLPSPSCHLLSGFNNPFALNTCKLNDPFIYIATLDGVGYELYYLKDDSYQRLDSFLGGQPLNECN